MRRIFAVLFLAAAAVSGLGCQNVARLGCEVGGFYLDVQRVFFGIDYPHGLPESSRQKYYGMPAPGRGHVCED